VFEVEDLSLMPGHKPGIFFRLEQVKSADAKIAKKRERTQRKASAFNAKYSFQYPLVRVRKGTQGETGICEFAES
jgi:hypothetical protein